MKSLLNITTSPYDLGRYANGEELHNFYVQKGLHGLEVMFLEDDPVMHAHLGECSIVGVHLRCSPAFLALWQEDELFLQRYSSEQQLRSVYGSATKEEMLQKLSRQLQFAQDIGAEYVVFHVCEIAPEDIFLQQRRHTDEAVVLAACQLINTLLRHKNYSFHFLCENLWWAGFNLENPCITALLMDNIEYDKKGIMLDAGHLLHTNRELRTQDEAIDFILRTVENDKTLRQFTRGMHLHQTLSGEYVKEMQKNPPQNIEVFDYIFKVDAHLPFSCSGVIKLLKTIAPEYLVHELISYNLQDHEEKLNTQLAALQQNR